MQPCFSARPKTPHNCRTLQALHRHAHKRSTRTLAIPLAQPYAMSNRLTMVFGVLATVLTIASIVVALYQCRRTPRTPAMDVEMQSHSSSAFTSTSSQNPMPDPTLQQPLPCYSPTEPALPFDGPDSHSANVDGSQDPNIAVFRTTSDIDRGSHSGVDKHAATNALSDDDKHAPTSACSGSPKHDDADSDTANGTVSAESRGRERQHHQTRKKP